MSGDVESLAEDMCVCCPQPHMSRGRHDAYRYGACEAHEEAARWLMRSDWLAAYVRDAVAAGKAEALREVRQVYDMQCPVMAREHYMDPGAYHAHVWWQKVLGRVLDRAEATR